AAAKPATAAAPAAPVEETMGIVADDDFEIRQGLEEVEFFKAQGLKDEAHALLKSLKEKFPQSAHWGGDAAAKAPAKSAANNDKVKQKKLEIETLGTKVKMTVQEDERDESDHDFYDLAQELDAELKEVSKSQSTPPAEVKDVFSAFKKGVAESVSADDFQTHFDLGIAYREMGLFDDAIEEFKLVGKVDGQKVSSLYQIGLSLAAKGEFKKAKESFDAALKEPNLVDQEKLSVTFELAEVLLKLEDPAKAKKLLQEVQKIDPEFREVADRIRQIG
ncbi:MAG: tetratricopeptide repeat protein, partial [Deltaproteobacteria bacterium]|nr:tetratricopeptide repeat protein [Deltaproteobacteria bacterium]